MLELRIKHGRKHVPLIDLPAYLGHATAAREIGDTVEGLIAFLDELGGDPDLEDGGDTEPSGDEYGDPAYCEWDTLPASRRKAGHLNGANIDPMRGMILEDEEEDDAPEEDDHSGQCTEDEISTGIVFGKGSPGCSISDPGGNDDGEAFPSYGLDQSRPRHWQPTDDLRARKPHRDRIRRTRCTKRVTQFGRATYGGYQLIV